MGHNLDLCMILGLPDNVICQTCNKTIQSFFDDYDIDCGEPNEVPGRWELIVYCNECDNENEFKYVVGIKNVS